MNSSTSVSQWPLPGLKEFWEATQLRVREALSCRMMGSFCSSSSPVQPSLLVLWRRTLDRSTGQKMRGILSLF